MEKWRPTRNVVRLFHLLPCLHSGINAWVNWNFLLSCVVGRLLVRRRRENAIRYLCRNSNTAFIATHHWHLSVHVFHCSPTYTLSLSSLVQFSTSSDLSWRLAYRRTLRSGTQRSKQDVSQETWQAWASWRASKYAMLRKHRSTSLTVFTFLISPSSLEIQQREQRQCRIVVRQQATLTLKPTGLAAWASDLSRLLHQPVKIWRKWRGSNTWPSRPSAGPPRSKWTHRPRGTCRSSSSTSPSFSSACFSSTSLSCWAAEETEAEQMERKEGAWQGCVFTRVRLRYGVYWSGFWYHNDTFPICQPDPVWQQQCGNTEVKTIHVKSPNPLTLLFGERIK